MSYEGMFPNLDAYDGAEDKWNEYIAELQAARNVKMEELKQVISKAIRPWIGSGEEPSVGITAINNEMADRAAAAAVKALQKANKV